MAGNYQETKARAIISEKWQNEQKRSKYPWYKMAQKNDNYGFLTLVNAEGGRKHHPLSENRNFSTTEHPIDLRPVCKFKFVRCGPVE